MIMRAQPYTGVLVRGSRRPALGMLMRRRRGLGNGCMSSDDIRAAMNCGQWTNCSPFDEECIACSAQCSNAISDAVDSGCIAPGTPLSWSCNTQVAVNYGSTGQAGQSDIVVGTGPNAYYAAAQQQQANPVAQQTTLAPATVPTHPLSPQPGIPTVVNPSPSTQLTSTGSSATSATSVLSQANGTALGTVAPTSTGNWFTDPTQEVIGGLPNWALLAIGAGGLFMVMSMASGRR